jgi:hypothetical protein
MGLGQAKGFDPRGDASKIVADSSEIESFTEAFEAVALG